MSKIIIRDYIDEDFNQVNSLWEVTGMGGVARGDNIKTISRCNNAGGRLIILEDIENKLIIGTSWLTTDSRRIYMHHFGILPNYQGKGYSHLLLDESLIHAKKSGMQIKLEVHKDNEIARNLYTNAGFNYLGDYEVYIIRDLSIIQ